MTLRILLPVLLFVCALPVIVSGQDNGSGEEQEEPGKLSIYINNPLGFLSKARGKIEYRFTKKHAVLLCFTEYHGYTPGIQSYLEYRRYFTRNTSDYFFYGKAGAGKTFVYGGHYTFVGTGLGQQFSFGKSKFFVIQFSEGLKICPVVNGDIEGEKGGGFRGLFYVTGPGAILDLAINLGWRF